MTRRELYNTWRAIYQDQSGYFVSKRLWNKVAKPISFDAAARVIGEETWFLAFTYRQAVEELLDEEGT